MLNIKVILRILFMFFLLLIIIELFLSLICTFPNDYYVGTPNSKFIWPVAQSNLNGIERDAVVEFDKYGTRSSSAKENKTQLLIFGGSTAVCSALSQEDTWSYKLEKKLGNPYWVGNIGRDGINSYHHVLQARHLLEKEDFKDVKYAVFFMGINDLNGYIGSPDTFLKQAEDIKKLYQISFGHLPNKKLVFYRRLTTFKVLQKIKRRKFKTLDPLKIAFLFKEQFRKRKEANKIEVLPNLAPGLNSFKTNIYKLISLCKKNGVEPIFVQQTSLWSEEESKENEEFIISGPIRYTQDYFSMSALSRGLDHYNKVLKETCNENNILLIPLTIPKSTKYYYDDIHYNKYGTELVSDSIYNHFKQNSI